MVLRSARVAFTVGADIPGPLNVEYEVTEFIPGMASFGFSVQHEFILRG
jgi:hypothetical protein